MKIGHDDWKTYCDYIWEGGDLPPSLSIVYVPLDWAYQFFTAIEETDNKYVLVSANSDYGLTEQAREPVDADLRKYFNMIDTNGSNYQPLVIPARCDINHCRITDKYSIKMYSWTNRTFNKIPDNIVKWFCANCNVEHDKIVHIPLGVPPWNINLLDKTVKNKFSIYINFQNNTMERVQLKNAFRGHPDVIIEQDVSHEQYVERLKECPFIFSLPGNGYDCFRTMESIYCGSIPVIVNDIWAKAYDNLPCIKVNSYFDAIEQLKNLWEKSGKSVDLPLDSPYLSMVQWANEINDAKELLNE